MYTPWLQPPPPPDAGYAEHTVGHHLRRGRRPRRISVALIGLDADLGARLRRQFYPLAWDFGKLPVADLGDVRKATPEFIIPLLRELHTAGIVPVLLGADAELFAAQYLAFGELNRQVGLLQVDQCVRPNVLDAATERATPPAFHLSHVGSQQHLLDPARRDALLARNFELYRLGQSRGNIGELEPAIRDADLMGIDVSALQWTEAPAQVGLHPSGFTLQEAGQLAYYAGHSDKLSSFGVYGLATADRSPNEVGLTVAAYAQLVWYFCYGMSQRSGDFPVTTKGLLEYVVDTRVADRLTFWRSPTTNRWWVQVPAGTYRGEDRHRLVACSYQDYLGASKEGELPERLVNAFSRF